AETKIGGYYMFRMQDSQDQLAGDNGNGTLDRSRYWSHRLQLNMDFLASPKTHAHLVTRVLNDKVVEGADAPGLGLNGAGVAAQTNNWQIRQAWLETEAWGIGLKTGQMPISLNDDILVNHDTTSFGTVMLSKSFGDVTVVAADVRLREGDVGFQGGTSVGATNLDDAAGPNTQTGGVPGLLNNGSNDDDEDLYVLSILGKAPSNISYQITAAYLNLGKGGVVANGPATAIGSGLVQPDRWGQDRLHDWWLAGTIKVPVSGIDLTGTLIYENGMGGFTDGDNNATALNSQLDKSGFLGALRAKGKLGFGGWNAYGFYASKNFTNITNRNPVWSDTWDQGGPGAKDLMNLVTGNAFNINPAGNGGNGAGAAASPTENAWGLGAGLTVEAGGWKIRPMLDYVSLVSDSISYGAPDRALARYDSAWGGSLMASTSIDKGTDLLLGATVVRPSDGPGRVANDNMDSKTMHLVQAAIKMAF
ncbi:MAG: hypothetical protein HQL60_07015, partial [Magnetococcales bacterium]|nr:hypothetical protein [Magnetococcales bacterium]